MGSSPRAVPVGHEARLDLCVGIGMLSFTKMHGLGNDFVLLDSLDDPRDLPASLAAKLADRRRGVGCDQVVQLMPGGEGIHAEMRIYNADGSRAEMCGNAIRCVALYLREQRGVGDEVLAIATLAGVKTVWFTAEGQVAVDMGRPQVRGEYIPMTWDRVMICEPLDVGDEVLPVTALSMGNPHCVLFQQREGQFPLEKYGPLIMDHPTFPNRTNVEFVTVLDRGNIRMRVWERGVGITPACGTGACAAAVASVLNRLADESVNVHLDGGVLHVTWRHDDHVIMTGPATFVFSGTIPLEAG